MQRYLFRPLKWVLKGLLYFVLILLAYGLLSVLLSAIPVNRSYDPGPDADTVYLATNGIHLDIILPISLASEALKEGLIYDGRDQYLAFGWGDEDFYINVPEWSDLTPKVALSAVFLPSPTLMHLTRYRRVSPDWVAVPISKASLAQLNAIILEDFQTEEGGTKIHLPGAGYNSRDEFYRAEGSYSFLFTCNTWANRIFKRSDLRATVWTPWDYALLKQHR